ncbi:MAG: class I SAM-dependent methyltransferase [Actinobacteria bacterium]|nr:class I SAM-dependent methyltransferase [Actinomycetota bacterium]
MTTHPAQQDVYAVIPRPELLPYLPKDLGSVLDVGCSRGGFGPTLRSHLGPDASIIGVEAVAESARVARAGGAFNEVIDGYFPDALADDDRRFDLITFNDVLEHLVDPWDALRACHDLLEPGGLVGAVIPSIRYAPVVWELIRGRWDYADDGTLDRTHLRFFTRATAAEMFTDCGYVVETCAMANPITTKWSTDPLRIRRSAKAAFAKLLGDAAYLHVVIVARRA